jgi:Na+/H+-dicarboxylate symporter
MIISNRMCVESSAAAIPITMKCVEAAGVQSQVAAFVIPLGATVNNKNKKQL